MVYTPTLLKLKIKIARFGKGVIQMKLPMGGRSDIINGRPVFYYPVKLNTYLPFPQEFHSYPYATDMLMHMHQKACIKISMTLLFIITKNVKKWPSAIERINTFFVIQ